MAQLDHIAIDKMHASIILGVRSMRGDAGSDYFLVRAKLRARISNECFRRPRTSKRHRTEALKIPSIAKEYEEKLGEKAEKRDRQRKLVTKKERLHTAFSVKKRENTKQNNKSKS